MYCDWLSSQSLANQNTVLPGWRQAIEETKWSDLKTVTVPKPLNLEKLGSQIAIPVKQKYPLVTKYWEAIQKREGYIASKPDPAMHNKLVKIGEIIDQWKLQYKWFNDFYEQ